MPATQEEQANCLSATQLGQALSPGGWGVPSYASHRPARRALGPWQIMAVAQQEGNGRVNRGCQPRFNNYPHPNAYTNPNPYPDPALPSAPHLPSRSHSVRGPSSAGTPGFPRGSAPVTGPDTHFSCADWSARSVSSSSKPSTNVAFVVTLSGFW